MRSGRVLLFTVLVFCSITLSSCGIVVKQTASKSSSSVSVVTNPVTAPVKNNLVTASTSPSTQSSGDGEQSSRLTMEDIDNAIQLVKQYYNAFEDKDLSAMNKLMSKGSQYKTVGEAFGSGAIYDLHLIGINQKSDLREKYCLANSDTIVPKENVIVVDVEYGLTFISDEAEENSTQKAGTITDWKFYLVRDNANSPWKIDKQGN